MGAHSVNWLVSPHLASWQKTLVKDVRRRASGADLWVLSSGTQSVNQIKCIGLSHAAVEASAAAVNDFLQAGRRDRWLIAIPEYHVGGYAIGVRARLAGAGVTRLGTWSAKRFVEAVASKKITLTSLVPTQIYDLAEYGQRAPECLRAIVVGGGALDPGLYQRARLLGWPVLPSYGLTETASQVATAPLSSLKDDVYPALKPLPHARLELRDGRLWIQADSLCHLVARLNTDGVFSLEDPLRGGWLPTEDRAEKIGGGWRILGRGDDVVKVLGVLVPVLQVEAEVREVFRRQNLDGRLTVIARPAEREENQLVLVTDSTASLASVAKAVDAYNSRASGPQRIARLAWVPQIPLNEMGKVQKAGLILFLTGS